MSGNRHAFSAYTYHRHFETLELFILRKISHGFHTSSIMEMLCYSSFNNLHTPNSTKIRCKFLLIPIFDPLSKISRNFPLENCQFPLAVKLIATSPPIKLVTTVDSAARCLAPTTREKLPSANACCGLPTLRALSTNRQRVWR